MKIRQTKIMNYRKSLEFGRDVGIDACIDYFALENEKVTIYHAIDTASGYLLALHFEKEETNIGYLNLLQDLSRH